MNGGLAHTLQALNQALKRADLQGI